MPIMDGFDACIRLRRGDKMADLQKIFCIEKKKTVISHDEGGNGIVGTASNFRDVIDLTP